MSKPFFYFTCTWSERRWKNNELGGKTLYFCKALGKNKSCDESICKIVNRKKIKEKPVLEDSRIIEDPLGVYTHPGRPTRSLLVQEIKH